MVIKKKFLENIFCSVRLSDVLASPTSTMFFMSNIDWTSKSHSAKARGRTLIQRFSNLNVNAFIILRQLKTLIQVTTPLQSVPSVQCRKAKFYIFIGTETSKSRSKRIHQML